MKKGKPKVGRKARELRKWLSNPPSVVTSVQNITELAPGLYQMHIDGAHIHRNMVHLKLNVEVKK